MPIVPSDDANDDMKLFSMIDDFMRSPIGLLVTACVIALALFERRRPGRRLDEQIEAENQQHDKTH